MGNGGKIKDGKKESGFTLLELVIAMFLTVIVSTAIYMAYNSQHKSYTVQEQVSGALIDANMQMINGTNVYDFGPVIWFWIGSSLV